MPSINTVLVGFSAMMCLILLAVISPAIIRATRKRPRASVSFFEPQRPRQDPPPSGRKSPRRDAPRKSKISNPIISPLPWERIETASSYKSSGANSRVSDADLVTSSAAQRTGKQMTLAEVLNQDRILPVVRGDGSTNSRPIF